MSPVTQGNFIDYNAYQLDSNEKETNEYVMIFRITYKPNSLKATYQLLGSIHFLKY